MGQGRNPKKIRKYIEMNENENITYGNLWDAVKAMLKGRFIAINAYVKRKKTPINNLVFCLKAMKKKIKLN